MIALSIPLTIFAAIVRDPCMPNWRTFKRNVFWIPAVMHDYGWLQEASV
jgi:hypothetical protein